MNYSDFRHAMSATLFYLRIGYQFSPECQAAHRLIARLFRLQRRLESWHYNLKAYAWWQKRRA